MYEVVTQKLRYKKHFWVTEMNGPHGQSQFLRSKLQLLTWTMRHPKNLFQKFSSNSISIDWCIGMTSIVFLTEPPSAGNLIFKVVIDIDMSNTPDFDNASPKLNLSSWELNIWKQKIVFYHLWNSHGIKLVCATQVSKSGAERTFKPMLIRLGRRMCVPKTLDNVGAGSTFVLSNSYLAIITNTTSACQ